MNTLRWPSLLVALLALLVIPSIVSAQCSRSAEVGRGPDTVQAFGYTIIDGLHEPIRTGNSFTMDCDAQLGSVQVYVKRATSDNRGVPPLVGGEMLRCQIYDMNENFIMETTTPFIGSSLVTFLFWDREFKLAAGTYQFLISTVDHFWGFLYVGEEYDGGTVMEDYLGFWLPKPAFDLNFSVYWNPDATFVENESQRFGTIKATYE